MKKISSLAAVKKLSVEDYNLILDAECQFSDCNATSIREYFYELLFGLWCHGEGFNSKRPFGTSGWDCDLFSALVQIGAIKGDVDEYNNADGYNKELAEVILSHSINVIFFGSP